MTRKGLSRTNQSSPVQNANIQAVNPKSDLSTALPNELWNQVLNHFSKKELKQLRLVGCRHLETLASSQLFHTAYVAARRGVLDIFMQITTHLTIRHFIREVVYDSSWVDPPDGVNRSRNGSYRITNACSNLPLAKLFQEQEIIQTRELNRCLKTAFAALTGVKRVVFADLSRTAGLIGDLPDPDGKPLSSRISSGSMDPSVKPCCFLNDCSYHQGLVRRQYHGYLKLMRILSDFAPSTFAELSLGDGKHSSDDITHVVPSEFVSSNYGGISNWYFTPLEGYPVDRFHYDVFRRLRKLDLTICFSSRSKDYDRPQCPRSGKVDTSILGKLLHVADDLEDLRLCGHIDTANLNFMDTLAGTTWSKLRKLELKYFEATYSNLAEFFERHQYSLEHVTFDFFNLLSGTWTGLLSPVQPELADISFFLGCAWQSGDLVEIERAEECTLWLPRRREDRHRSDVDEPELDNDRESSSDEEFEYSSGSEGCDDDDLDSDMLRKWAAD